MKGQITPDKIIKGLIGGVILTIIIGFSLTFLSELQETELGSNPVANESLSNAKDSLNILEWGSSIEGSITLLFVVIGLLVAIIVYIRKRFY